MKDKLSFGIFCLVLVLALGAVNLPQFGKVCFAQIPMSDEMAPGTNPYPIMQPGEETISRWAEEYEAAPRVVITDKMLKKADTVKSSASSRTCNTMPPSATRANAATAGRGLQRAFSSSRTINSLPRSNVSPSRWSTHACFITPNGNMDGMSPAAGGGLLNSRSFIPNTAWRFPGMEILTRSRTST